MTEREASHILAGIDLIPVIQGSLVDVKRMRDSCLAADIPVAVLAPPGKG